MSIKFKNTQTVIGRDRRNVVAKFFLQLWVTFHAETQVNRKGSGFRILINVALRCKQFGIEKKIIGETIYTGQGIGLTGYRFFRGDFEFENAIKIWFRSG